MGILVYIIYFFQFRCMFEIFYLKKKTNVYGLPRWLISIEPACRRGGHGFDPWPGKITHVMRHNSWACALEPGSRKHGDTAWRLLKAVPPESMLQCKEQLLWWEACSESRPRTSQLEKSQQWRLLVAKTKQINIFKKCLKVNWKRKRE